MQKINWHNPQLIENPSGTRRDTRYQVTCNCGYIRWLTKRDAQRASQRSDCKRCQCRKAGRRGYEVTIKRHGRERINYLLAEYQRNNPSQAEKRMIERLTPFCQDTGFYFEFQPLVEGTNFIADFYIYSENGSLHKVIEVNGFWHQQKGENRDQRFAKALSVPVIFIKDEDIEGFDPYRAIGGQT